MLAPCPSLSTATESHALYESQHCIPNALLSLTLAMVGDASTLANAPLLPLPSLVSPQQVKLQRCSTKLSAWLFASRFPAKAGWLKARLICSRTANLGSRSLIHGNISQAFQVLLYAQLPGLEVWFQREVDVVRKIRAGDVDLGIVGYDTVCEYGQGDEDLIVVHDALDFGACYLTVAIPTYGIFTNVSSVAELVAMPQWSDQRPLRIATAFQYLGKKFIENIGLKHVQLLTADGALEAAPAMGIADAILDLVGSGTTLRENSLKEIDGGVLLKSQGVLVASKHALLHRETALEKTHEIIERIEAHLRARSQYTVIAHMRGKSMEDVAKLILNATDLHGLQGPTISPVFSKAEGSVQEHYYAVVICVTKSRLYDAVKQLRQVGGSGVLVSPLTYIFDEEPPRWQQLLNKLKPS